MEEEKRLHILARHLKVKGKWEKSGFAKEYPDLYDDLLLKIKAIEENKFEVKDVTLQEIGKLGALFPFAQMKWDLEYFGDNQMKKSHIEKKIKKAYKYIDNIENNKDFILIKNFIEKKEDK